VKRSSTSGAASATPAGATPGARTPFYAREIEAPSGLGVGTARAIARAYGVFASGGRELGLRQETIEVLKMPARPARHGFFDECLRCSAKFSLGFMQPSDSFAFGHPGAFGAPGAGGAMGYADPQTGIGYGYVTNRMGTKLSGDPRDIALRAAIPGRADRSRPTRPEPGSEDGAPALARRRQPCDPGVEKRPDEMG
jgi:CubicO group peptidase (beta-lactamase class C family)